MERDLEAALPALFDAIRVEYERDGAGLHDALASWRAGDESVERFVIALASDPRWEARVLVAEVLRYRPSGSDALSRACVLVAMMQRETDAHVRAAIVSAFVDLAPGVGDVLTLAFVARFARDADARVRFAVAVVLAGGESDAASATLIALSRDDDDHVRDWACFALGHRRALDSDEIREALADRLDDPDEETREEAATGLALRDDARGIDRMVALLEAFEDDGVTERVLGTAAERPSVRYVAPLEAIVDACPELESATEALEACRALARKIACRSPRHVGCACMRAWFPE